MIAQFSPLRYLRRHPAEAGSRVAIIAFAVTATTIGYVLVWQLLFQPAPFRDAERVVALTPPLEIARRLGMGDLAAEKERADHSPFIEQQAHVRFGIFGDADGPALGQPEIIHYEVSPTFLDFLGVSPLLGRGFVSTDLGMRPVQAIIGHELWRTQFGSDRSVLGQVVTLGAGRAVIVGIMRQGFAFPVGANVWTPVQDPTTYPPSFVRLKPSATVGQLAAAFPRLDVYPAERLIRPTNSAFVRLVLGATVLVWIVSSLQIAGLTVAGVVASAGQLWVRRSLGAAGHRLLLGLMAELAVVVGLGAATAWLVLPQAIGVMGRLLPSTITRGQPLHVDGRAVFFSIFIAAATSLMGLLVGFRMASGISERSYGAALVSSVATRRLSSWLCAAQLVATFVLIYLVGLAIVSAGRLSRVDLGFRPQQLLLARLPSSLESPPAVWSTTLDAMDARIGGLPGVLRVARSMTFPLARGSFRGTAQLPRDPTFPKTTVRVNYVTKDYFLTIGARFTMGQGFTEKFNVRDMVINRTMARLIGGHGPVVGQFVQVTSQQSTVIGVIDDLVDGSPASAPDPQVFVLDPGWLARVFQIQVVGNPVAIVPAVRQILEASSGTDKVSVAPYEDYVRLSTAQYRIQMGALMFLGCAGLWVAAAGVAGALTLWLRQDMRELALRIALGADARAIRLLVVGRLARIGGVGCVGGSILALLVAHGLRAAMYGVGATDFLILALTVITVVVAIGAAAAGPLERAARIQPAAALRRI